MGMEIKLSACLSRGWREHHSIQNSDKSSFLNHFIASYKSPVCYCVGEKLIRNDRLSLVSKEPLIIYCEIYQYFIKLKLLTGILDRLSQFIDSIIVCYSSLASRQTEQEL